MEQTCSNNILSLHLERCSSRCPNKDVCYHIKKKFSYNNIINSYSITSYIDFICSENKDITVYDSVCSIDELNTKVIIENLKIHKNYNITISCKHLPNSTNITEDIIDQIQLSVYSLLDCIKYKNYQKLFLIKDKESYDLFLTLLDCKIGRIHFNIDKDTITRETLFSIIKEFTYKRTEETSLDSCLESLLVNGECPYLTNYVDLSFDSTIRKCPFEKNGIQITDELHSYKDMINILNKTEQNECRLQKIMMLKKSTK